MLPKIISTIKLLIRKYPFLIIFCFWLVMQTILLSVFGIVTVREAIKYYDEAKYLLQQGHFSEPKYLLYSGYIFLHIIFIKLNCETAGVFITQILANLLSLYLFFKLAFIISKDIVIAFIAGLLLAICYPWQYWAVNLFTESFFCSLIIIFTYVLFNPQMRSKAWLIITVCLFLLLLISRPTGILFIPVMCCLFMYKLIRSKRITVAITISAIGLTVFIVVLEYAMKGGSSYDFMKPLVENNVICDIPEFVSPQHSTVSVLGNSLESIWIYIKQNTLQFLKLAGLKFLSYWGMTRTYYDAKHNLGLMCFFYPLYFLAIIGLRRLWSMNKYLLIYIVGLLIIFTLSVMFTCDDWNNRFIMPVLPFVLLLAAIGVKHLGHKFVSKTKLTNAIQMNEMRRNE